MTQELSKLTQRLEQLERQNRRFKKVGVGLAGALGVVALMAANPLCDIVSAERFVLRDSHGKTRMLMDAYHTEPSIQLRNQAGKTVASFGVDKQGEAYLTFFDANGNPKGSSKAKSEGSQPSQCTDKKKDDGSIAMR